MERLIKNVNKESWREFKAESVKHNMRMGEFLAYLVEEHKKREHNGKGWEIIRNAKRTISDEEAEKIKKAMSAFEKIYGFEDV